jgi:Carboxypeptidase regulatory-like domain/Divergent InlB B-repeat domain
MAATGAISGTVTGAGAGPLDGMRVCAHSETSSFVTPCTTTETNGHYSIPNLADGGYRIYFEPGGDYLGQWWERVETEVEATTVTVAGGAAVEGIDAELALGAAVEGTVTVPGGAGLAGVRICAITPDGSPTSTHCAASAADGAYHIGAIPIGTWKLSFEPEYGSSYPTGYFPGVASIAEGTTVQLSAGATKAGVNLAMQPGGTIAGKVVNEAGEPVQGLSACVYPVLGKAGPAYCFENEGRTAGDGTYAIRGLWSGEYKVVFGRGTGNYLEQAYPGQPTRAAGTAVTVTAPATIGGIDATLHSGGVIAGTLTEAGSGNPLTLQEICASRVGTHSETCVQAKSDGTYSIGSLASGDYEVKFGGIAFESPYVPNFYDGAADAAGATPVPVTAGATTAGIDGELEKGGTISGHVTDAQSAESAPSIQVCARASAAEEAHCDTTLDEGDYTIVGLPAGSYAVGFTPAGGGIEGGFRIGNQHYVHEFYEDAGTEGEATRIPSGPGTNATGIDAAMHEGGGISGTVTGLLGEPLRAASVCVVESAVDLGSRCAETNGHGEYEIPGLRPGLHVLYFHAPGGRQGAIAPQYSGGVSSFGEATAVTVAGTAVTTGADARLFPAATIEGTVRDAYDGSPIAEVQVCAETSSPGTNCDETDADGTYAIDVPPGSYQVKFAYGYYETITETEVEEFVTQYFDGAGGAGAATPVTVMSGSTRSGVDAALQPAPGRVDHISVATAGAGAVTSSPAGIDCGATCSSDFETRKTVTLAAEPSPGSTFTGWTGACSGTGPCQIRLTEAAEVTATFAPTGDAGPSDSSSPSPDQGGTANTVTPKAPSRGKPKPKRVCKRGFKLKKFGKREHCVRVPKKHHPRKHHPKSAASRH